MVTDLPSSPSDERRKRRRDETNAEEADGSDAELERRARFSTPKKAVVDLTSDEDTKKRSSPSRSKVAAAAALEPVTSPTMTSPTTTGQADNDDDDDLFTCPLCLQLLYTPCLLPCKHPYCLSCLKRYVPDDAAAFPCPQCRRPTPREALVLNPDAEAEIIKHVGESIYQQRKTEVDELDEAYQQRVPQHIHLTVSHDPAKETVEIRGDEDAAKLVGITLEYFDSELEGVVRRPKTLHPFVFTIPAHTALWTFHFHLTAFHVVAADKCATGTDLSAPTLVAVHPFDCAWTVDREDAYGETPLTVAIPIYSASSAEMDSFDLFAAASSFANHDHLLHAPPEEQQAQRQAQRRGLWDLIAGADLPNVYDAQDGLYVPGDDPSDEEEEDS